ncbi:hypothetical protein MFIFM68171_01563 [Madurella fahalii]|uniref:Uncharacterized protein n=1 Tax=Madurella fahalii TaxID=1157608 RepID=A0ABQ0G0S2_9PEZI
MAVNHLNFVTFPAHHHHTHRTDKLVDIGNDLKMDGEGKGFLADQFGFGFTNEQFAEGRGMLSLSAASTASGKSAEDISPVAQFLAIGEAAAGKNHIVMGIDEIKANKSVDSIIEARAKADTKPEIKSAPLPQPQKEQAMTPEFLSAWNRKMGLARLHGKRYKMTEARLRDFRWEDEFFIDIEGRLAVRRAAKNEHFIELAKTDPRYRLPACRWYKSKVLRQQPPPGVPLLTVTDPEGRNWYAVRSLWYDSEDGGECAVEDESDDDEWAMHED